MAPFALGQLDDTCGRRECRKLSELILALPNYVHNIKAMEQYLVRLADGDNLFRLRLEKTTGNSVYSHSAACFEKTLSVIHVIYSTPSHVFLARVTVLSARNTSQPPVTRFRSPIRSPVCPVCLMSESPRLPGHQANLTSCW